MVGLWPTCPAGSLALAPPGAPGTSRTWTKAEALRRAGRELDRLREELVDVDDDPRHLAGGDEALGVGRGDGEHQAPALDLVEDRLGLDGLTDRGRVQVVELDAHPNARHPRTETSDERGAGGLFAQRDDARCGQHSHLTGPHGDR